MKTKKIILLIITLVLVCVAGFSGLVGAFAENLDINVLSQPFDNLFPPQSTDNIYVYLDFTYCGIPQSVLDSSYFTFSAELYDSSTNSYTYPYLWNTFEQLASVDLVYQFSISSSGLVFFDAYQVVFNVLFPELTGYGIPSIDNVIFYDTELVSFEPTGVTFGSSNIWISYFNHDINTIVITFGNSELALVNQYNTLRNEYNSLNTQYTTLQGQYNTLQGQYNTLNIEYSSLQGQYNILQSYYDDLYNDWEEERDSKEHYQSLLREANTTIDELEYRIQQLELFLDEQPVSAGFGWITYAFQKVGEILSIELLPGISIGLLALIPLVLGVVFFVLRLIRGE